MTDQRIVVVGGGIAGVSTASALRAGGFEGELTLVDAGEFPYDRPPLSKDYLAGVKDLKQVALQPAEWFDDNRIRLRNLSRVASIRPGEGSVELDDGSSLPADKVVLATGGFAARPPVQGADGPRVHVLRTSTDADALREALVPGAKILVVGAGLIGAEVASTALGLGVTVTLVDPIPVPLAGAVGVEVATWLHGLHTDRGVTTVLGGVQSIDDDGSAVSVTIGGESRPRRFDAVVLGVGMVPDTGLAEAAGLEIDRGIVVDDGHVTSNSSILAVGDPIRIRRDGVVLPRAEHWEAAQQDGVRAAASILGNPPPAASASWFWTDRHGKHVEAVGRMADAERTILRGEPGEGPFAAFALRDRKVVGAVAVDDSNVVRAARRMIDRSIVVDVTTLQDPASDLRKMLRG